MRKFWLVILVFCAALAAAQEPFPTGDPYVSHQLVAFPVYTLNAAPVPGATLQTVGPTGQNNYCYWAVANYQAGSVLSSLGCIPNSNGTLSVSHYNQVLPWMYPPGITNVDILRTSANQAPAGTCNCAVATGVTAGAINDQSNSLSAYTVSLLNPNTLALWLDNEVVGLNSAHLLLRKGWPPPGTLVADLSQTGGTVTSITPATGGGITLTPNPITASGTVGLLTTCSTNQVLQWNGTSWACATGSGGTPAFPSLSFQFNNSGSFGGAFGFNYTAGTGVNFGDINSDILNNVLTVTPDWNFTACASGCPYVTSGLSTIAAGSNTVTLTPVPPGINGTDNPHYIQLSATGTPTEYVLITGGTAAGGASSGTLTFTAAYAHGSTYIIGSASTGIEEAAAACSRPGCVIKLIPAASYVCYAPIALLPNSGNDVELDGQFAILYNASFSSCLIMGGQPNAVWGTTSGLEAIKIHHLDMRPQQTNWSVAPTSPSTISSGSATATLTIATCPSGFYANIPNQLLWLAGTSGGVPTTVYGYGEFVITTAGTCQPGVTNGTIAIQQATPNAFGGFLSAHGAGYTLSNGVGPYIEDALSDGGHISDVRWATGSHGGLAGNEIQIDNDQACGIDNVDMAASAVTRKDADFQGAGVFFPGAYSSNAGICYMGPNVNISEPSHCVNDFGGNDFHWSDGVCQNYTAGAIVIGGKRGGFGQYTSLLENVHFETGGAAPPFGTGNIVGNPEIMVVGGANHPIRNNSEAGGSPFSGGNASAWPVFQTRPAESGQAYYLVAHNNTASGCTSGGDCVSPPILIGVAVTTAPNINPVPVTWYGWGDNTLAPTLYDLLRITYPVSLPQPPEGTGNWAVATGLAPSSICSVRNICSVTDNVASPTSYTTIYLRSSNKRAYFDSYLLPGNVSIAGDGGINDTSTPAQYIGTPTCVNGMEFLGANYLAQFTSHSSGSEGDLQTVCPNPVAPIGSLGPMQMCISAAGTCGFTSSGTVTIAPSATTVTVSTTAVTPWSRFQLTSNQTAGAALAVTCDTGFREYAVTAVTPGVSFVITASAAPTNSACLNFEVDNSR